MPPKKVGGRPRIYRTDEEARKADLEKRKLRRIRAQLRAGPADFIAFEPSHPSAPSETPASELRTSPDIRIPLERSNSQHDAPSGFRPMSPPPTEQPISEEDAALALQILQIRMQEQEANVEQNEYESRISHQLQESDKAAAEILMGLRTDTAAEEAQPGRIPMKAGEHISADYAGRADARLIQRDRNYDGERLPACFSPIASIDGQPSIIWANDSIDRLSVSDISVTLQRTQEHTTQPQTPIPQRSSSAPQPSTIQRKNNRRSTSFPAQKNNLMSWVRSIPRQSTPSIDPLSSPSVTNSCPTNASPAPAVQAENLMPSSPAHSMIHAHSNPRLSTSMRAVTPPTQVASHAPTPNSIASPVPAEHTAAKLARQLRDFQGCTHEQHYEADQLHHGYHQRSDVHSECSSIQQITCILRGSNTGSPLPDVLSSPKLMKPADVNGLDIRASFEGSSAPTTAAEPRDEHLPRNLCLSQYHTTSKKNRSPKVSFDIDSTSCFPTSLAIARLGINWFPKSHAILNLTADIHFGLRVPAYNKREVLTSTYTPLHKISHYCFGSAMGMESLLIYIFFPMLHLESSYEHSTYLSKEDYELLYDGVLSPALNQIVDSSNLIQHYPASARIVEMDSTAISGEALARKEISREQLLQYTIKPQYLDSLWNLIIEIIDTNPSCERFKGATLFMHAKNTKLHFMDTTGNLNAAYESWENQWSKATDPQFYNKDRTYVDLAKQITSVDSALPYDQIPADHEAEIYLWKKCCMDSYAKTRTSLNADGSPAKGNPRRSKYMWATMRDAMNQTFFAAPQGKESQDGLIYSQFYNLIKTPFDTCKVYVFDNEALENLALDPGYIRSLQQEGGSITFSKAVCEFGYLHSKKRALANLLDNRWKSYGIREEHRISLTMMEEISQQWRQWDLYDDEANPTPAPLPYYIVPTQELLGFLYAQINKYCFLFEHVLAHTAKTYSLPETIVMVTALRALRFCYSSSILQRESLLYKDRWEVIRHGKPVVKEGLGMRETIERCGIGWFLPKLNWATWRFAPPHGENMLVGNMLMHEEYKRRWRAVKDLRDVYIRFAQAESWYDRYHVQRNAPLCDKWLEYLHALNLEQFDLDVWKAMLKCNTHSPELTPGLVQERGDIRFCYRGMKAMFTVDGSVGPPHFVTGNKMRFDSAIDLLDFLFLWDDGKERRGWGNKAYRVILQKSFELIERRFGSKRADQWLDEFFHLVRLTHWVLPYPSNSAFISSTKTSRTQGLKARMMWFSTVYTDPAKVELPFRSHPITLHGILWKARQQVFGDGRGQPMWGTAQLIAACRHQGIKIFGVESTDDFWVAGKRSIGVKGFLPVWERSQPPKLAMMEQIKNKSLDELEDVMNSLSREYSGNIVPDFTAATGETIVNEAVRDHRDPDHGRQLRSTGTGGGIMAAFGRQSPRSSELHSEGIESMDISASGGSLFVPSISER